MINETAIKVKLNDLGMLKINEPLKNHTSFKTGGPADYMIWPADIDSLRSILLLSKDNNIPVTILGGCTNVLVGDRGIRGIAVMFNNSAAHAGKVEAGKDGAIYSDSAVKKDDFLRFCLSSGYEGMEFMAGIPGCIGGGIIMNAGTVDGNFAGILDRITLMNTEGCFAEQKINGKTAAYREMGISKGSIILGCFCKLKKTDDSGKVKNKIETILKERRSKHPLNYPSAGSVFKNPSGHSSWKLINDAGLRGKRVGGACVSELHTNFIINSGSATSIDILNLIEHVKEKVYVKFNIVMEPEIKLVGEF